MNKPINHAALDRNPSGQASAAAGPAPGGSDPHAHLFNPDGSWSDAFHDLPYADQMAVRRERIQDGLALIAATPPRVVDEEAARKRADAAVRSLLPGLLSDDELTLVSKGQRAFEGRR